MSSPAPSVLSNPDDDTKAKKEDITFKFCRECSNMLYPKEDRMTSRLMFACRTCQFSEEAKGSCVFRNTIHNTVGENSGVTQDVGSDPTVGDPFDELCDVCCTLCGREIEWCCEWCGEEVEVLQLQVGDEAEDEVLGKGVEEQEQMWDVRGRRYEGATWERLCQMEEEDQERDNDMDGEEDTTSDTFAQPSDKSVGDEEDGE